MLWDRVGGVILRAHEGYPERAEAASASIGADASPSPGHRGQSAGDSLTRYSSSTRASTSPSTLRTFPSSVVK